MNKLRELTNYKNKLLSEIEELESFVKESIEDSKEMSISTMNDEEETTLIFTNEDYMLKVFILKGINEAIEQYKLEVEVIDMKLNQGV